jgi:hypothetical protein
MSELERVREERDAAIARIGLLILAARGNEADLPVSLRAGLWVAEDEFFNRPTAEGRERRKQLGTPEGET